MALDPRAEPHTDAAGVTHLEGLRTRDPAMRRVLHVVSRVAGEDVTVLVRGETGSGKELVAQALHRLSPRAEGPFRAINCAAINPNLLESELFGHVRGAFTGAHRDTPGHVQLAHKGTLFLDEVAELPLDLQAKLLRVLETRTVTPVGGRDPIAVDLRIVSATHRALRREVEAGRFRADLMYRLRVIPIFLPPLRERPADLPLLIEQLCRELAAERARPLKRPSAAAFAVLAAYDFPGNVRELKNVLHYGLTMADGDAIEPADLPPELGQPTAGASGDDRVRLQAALAEAGGHRGKAAAALGISRITLWRRLRDLGLVSGRETSSRRRS